VSDTNRLPSNDMLERTGLWRIANHLSSDPWRNQPTSLTLTCCVMSATSEEYACRDVRRYMWWQSRRLVSMSKSMFPILINDEGNRHSLQALFLTCISNSLLRFKYDYPVWVRPLVGPSLSTTTCRPYSVSDALTNQFYPERTSWSPGFITPEIKVKLWQKNRLMRAGRVKEASHNMKRPTSARLVGNWCQRRGQQCSNWLFVKIQYCLLIQATNSLSLSVMCLDPLPAWFLQLVAIVLFQPITILFKLSLNTSSMEANKHPTKNSVPKFHANLRLIFIN